MFAIGEAVLYGNHGVCTVERVEEMKVGRNKTDYLVLRPVYHDGSTLFIPTNNEQLLQKMRPILTEDELHHLLQQADQMELSWIDDATERKTAFQAILTAGERVQILLMLRLLYRHRQTLHNKNKHLRAADEQLLRDGEKLLCDEFAFILQIPRHQAAEYIRSRLEQAT